MTCILRVRRFSIPARIVAAFCGILISSCSLFAQSGAATFNEYSIPTINSLPVGIVNGPDGALWFVERAKVGRITTGGTITEYAAADGGYNITAGPDGALWFTGNGKVKRITTSGDLTQFTMPSSSSDPAGIATGSDGALWFTESNNSKIGRMTTAGDVTEFALPASSSPGGITPGPDGALWFTEWSGNRIGRITTAGAITEYSIPSSFSGASDIVTGSDGSLWFTETNANKIGRITTAGVITEFTLLTSDSPRGIASSIEGYLWIAQRDRIVKMTTSGVMSEYPVPNLVPSFGGMVADIAAASGGYVWFTDNNGRIGRLDPNATVSGATLVQSYSREAAGVSSVSLPMGMTSAGNTLLVFVRMSTTTQTVSISDTTGNTYAEAVSQVQDQNDHQIHLFYTSSIAGGSTTVRADFSDTNDHPWLAAFEYAGIRATDPLDQIAHSQGFGTSASSGSTAPTTHPYELLFAGTGQLATTYDPVQAGPGFVMYQRDPGPSRAAAEAVAVNSAGSYTATFVTNDVQVWSAVLATFVANGPVEAPAITTTSLPGAQQGGSYSAAVSGSGGAIPYTWSVVSGSLPPGTHLSAEAGVIYGSPSTAGNYSFTVQITDAHFQTATQALGITIGAEAPRIDTIGLQLTDGQRGTPYSNATLRAIGGTSPYTWSVVSGNLPSGLTMNPNGSISGTPTDSRVNNFTVQVTDASSLTATKDLSITVYDWTEQDSPSVSFSGAWNLNTSSADSGGTANLSMDSGARARFVFAGTQVSWIGLKEQYSGIANVYLDDILVATVDTYSNQPAYKSRLYTAGGLADAQHTLDVEATGRSNSVSGGAWIWVDAFETLGSMGSGPVFPSVITSALPVATQNQTYTTTLSAMGGSAPYTWINSGNLPAGLSLDSNAGTISGTPTATGWTTFTIQLKDTESHTFNRSLSLTVLAPGLVVTTSSLPSITQNGAYSASLAATGGTAPYNWSLVSGSLPEGLSLSGSNGRISGTPVTAGTTNFTVQVADAGSQTAIKALTITINPLPVITTNALPDATQNANYNGNLAAANGTPPYRWSIVSGSLPSGMIFFGTNSCCQIQGAPTTTGTSEFNVQVTDSSDQTATKALSITVNPANFRINNTSLPGGRKNNPYSITLTASGGATPYTWAVISGSLPPGLSLDSASGVLSGTPSTGGSSNFTVQVTDANEQTAARAFSILIDDASFGITNSSLPNGTQYETYNVTLSGSGGTTPYIWSIIQGNLPSGLTLGSSSGTISGVPTATGTSGFTVRITDANGLIASRFLSITINLNAVTISTTSLPDGIQSSAYQTTLEATGGATPYSWSIVSGNLPLGLSFDSSTGVLSGTPQSSGTSNFTVRVTDASSQTATKALSILIQPVGEASGYIEETHPSITYEGAWNSNGGSFNSGSSAMLAADPGASATVHFTGTGISWIGYSDEWSGIAEVYVDGELQATVDTYRSPAQNQANEYAVNGLVSGSHTLAIVVTGNRNPSSAQAWIWVDAFRVQP